MDAEADGIARALAKAQLEQGAELLSLADGVRLVSEDGATALATISFDLTRLELPQESKDAVMEHVLASPIDGIEASFSTDIAQGVPEILGVGEGMSGRLLLWDALDARFRAVRLRRDPGCALCGGAAAIRDLSAHAA